ncbi:MAG: ABC transporter permease [Caulobacteraceae bacterium]
MPKDTLAAVYGVKGQVSAIYMKPVDSSRRQELIESISKAYRRYSVVESIPEEDIRRGANSFKVSFMMMVVIVLLISVFTIYTSFRVITTEMLPIIGTFRSIGATKRMTDLVLIMESILYGAVGGVLGCFLGVGVLHLMMGMILTAADRGAGFTADVEFTAAQLVVAFLMAVLLLVVSSIIPIIRVSKISVKDIVLNKVENIRKKGTLKLVSGLVLLTASVILPRVIPREFEIVVDMLCLIFSSILVILLIPFLTAGFIKLLERIYTYVFGNEGVLAAKNLKENKSVLNNISLLAMGISALLLISTISYSVTKEVGNAYRTFNYDIQVGIPDSDRQKLKLVETVDGVADVYGSRQAYNVELADGKNRIVVVYGTDTDKFLDYLDTGIMGDRKKLLQELDSDRNIIISNALKYKFGVDIWDQIALKTKVGGRAYKVIGLCETMMYNGQLALISDRYLKSDMQIKYFTDILVKTSKAPEAVQESIKEVFKNQNIYITTINEMERLNNESNASLFNIFKLFSVIAMVIGIFGVVNNFATSFMERKRALAMFWSAGMSKLQIIKMIFIEALSGGLIGGSVGALSGVIMVSLIPYLMRAIDIPIGVHYSAAFIISSMLGGAAASLVASVSPALKSSRLNIIEAIKYE